MGISIPLGLAASQVERQVALDATTDTSTTWDSKGARLEFSRTYFEVGKRLLEPKSKYKYLKGITAKEYLEKARVLFEEMNLKWDLEQ